MIIEYIFKSVSVSRLDMLGTLQLLVRFSVGDLRSGIIESLAFFWLDAEHFALQALGVLIL